MADLAGEPFFLCVFAPLRLCVETSLNTCDGNIIATLLHRSLSCVGV